MIKIKEEFPNPIEKGVSNISVKLENKEVLTFEKYPVIVNSHVMKYIQYDVLKKQKELDYGNEKLGILDKAKQKALEVKDTVADTTKELTNEPKGE